MDGVEYLDCPEGGGTDAYLMRSVETCAGDQRVVGGHPQIVTSTTVSLIVPLCIREKDLKLEGRRLIQKIE